MKKVLALLLVLSLAMMFAACTPKVDDNGGAEDPVANTDPIKVGCIQDTTGGSAVAGQPNDWGAHYAVDEINAAGGINGRMIELISYDCKNDVDEGVNCYRKLVDEDGVCAIIGPPLSNPASAWVDLSEEDQIPIVGHFMDEVCTTNPDTGEVYPYMFLAEPSCAVQSDCLAAYAMEDLGLKSFATLYNTGNAFAVAHAKPFMVYVEANGGQILAEETFTWTDTDYSAQALKIAQANPDAVFLSDYAAQMAPCYDALRDAGYEGVILGANTMAAPFNTMVKNEVYDCYYLQNYDLLNESEGRIFEITQAHMTDTGTEYPKANVGFGYDAVQVLANAMRKATDPTDGAEVREILETQTVNVPLCVGTITIDPATHRPNNMGMYIASYDETGAEMTILKYMDYQG